MDLNKLTPDQINQILRALLDITQGNYNYSTEAKNNDEEIEKNMSIDSNLNSDSELNDDEKEILDLVLNKINNSINNSENPEDDDELVDQVLKSTPCNNCCDHNFEDEDEEDDSSCLYDRINELEINVEKLIEQNAELNNQLQEMKDNLNIANKIICKIINYSKLTSRDIFALMDDKTTFDYFNKFLKFKNKKNNNRNKQTNRERFRSNALHIDPEEINLRIRDIDLLNRYLNHFGF